MPSRTSRFEQKAQAAPEPHSSPLEAEEEPIHFSPEQEASLLSESNDLKSNANKQFSAEKYEEAIETYKQALHTCPKSLFYERAILNSNLAACHLKTTAWKEAISEAGTCLDLLDLAEGKNPQIGKTIDADGISEGHENGKESIEAETEEADEEIISPGAVLAEDISAGAKRKLDLERIRIKALLRRGKARMEIASWASLQGAEEDYKALAQFASLSATDRKTVQSALSLLPGRIKVAQEKEMGEMWGKLKDLIKLGNGLLKPFGLSTDNFQMEKDEKTGGYSMNFNQGGAKN